VHASYARTPTTSSPDRETAPSPAQPRAPGRRNSCDPATPASMHRSSGDLSGASPENSGVPAADDNSLHPARLSPPVAPEAGPTPAPGADTPLRSPFNRSPCPTAANSPELQRPPPTHPALGVAAAASGPLTPPG